MGDRAGAMIVCPFSECPWTAFVEQYQTDGPYASVVRGTVTDALNEELRAHVRADHVKIGAAR